jgi:hypothetical protein
MLGEASRSDRPPLSAAPDRAALPVDFADEEGPEHAVSASATVRVNVGTQRVPAYARTASGVQRDASLCRGYRGRGAPDCFRFRLPGS